MEYTYYVPGFLVIAELVQDDILKVFYSFHSSTTYIKALRSYIYIYVSFIASETAAPILTFFVETPCGRIGYHFLNKHFFSKLYIYFIF